MKKLYNICIAVFIACVAVNAQQTPGAKQTESILITNVTAHLGNGELIENAAVGFENGKITYVGEATNSSSSDFDQVINAEGKHVYPGFIVSNTTNGLLEIDAVRATKDTDEVGEFLPHIRSIIAYNAESKVTETLRPNGVLMGQITPRGGTISGTSSVVQFDAWNWEDAALRADDGIHVNWPLSVSYGKYWLGEEKGPKNSKTYTKTIEKMETFFTNAKAYLAGEKSRINLPYESVEGLLNGTANFYVHVNGEKEILDAIDFCQTNGIKKLVIVHGAEAYKLADVLVEKSIPVIVDRAHRLPYHTDQDIHFPFKHVAELMNKGVIVSIGTEGDMERMQSRNLPFYAGTHAAYGLDKEDALKLITSNAAKILGVDHLVGTLEMGKDATLFISEGDALDMRTNKLTHAFIQGRKVSLETHQTELYDRYMEKYQE